MGFAICRFNKDTGCTETGSKEYHVQLTDLGVWLNVPEMWKHYMVDHLVKANEQERHLVMTADPGQALCQLLATRGVNRESIQEVSVLYVERISKDTYTHKIGTVPDSEFISKLELLLKQHNQSISHAQDNVLDAGHKESSQCTKIETTNLPTGHIAECTAGKKITIKQAADYLGIGL